MNHSNLFATILGSSLALLGACAGDDPGATGATESTGEESSSATSEGATSAATSDGETTGGASDGETTGGTTTTGEPTTGEPTTSTTTGEPTTSTTTGEPTTGTTGTTDTTGEPTTTGDTDTDGTTTGGDSGGAAECFDGKFSDEVPPPDYDQFEPVIGSHCLGTDHQTITDVEKVIFLGDSVTRGTPDLNNILWTDAYRFVLSKALAEKFGITLKKNEYDDMPQTNLLPSTDDFDSCAEWGDRTDDLAAQIEECFPNDVELKTTLIVITIGGNDLAAWAKAGTDANNPKSPEELLAEDVPKAVGYMSDALDWLTDANHFPNGSYVVFANTYEYTDRTGEMGSCIAAQWQSLEGDWPEGMDVLNTFNEAYMDLAVETQTDMIFMSERFCGWGYKHDDPNNVCYDPDAENLFDLTCIHPTTAGDKVIADMFYAVIDE